ncbi:MAG: NAD-binding protein [bacterium]
MPKVIVLGCGRQGARLAELMEADRWSVSIIDNSPTSFNRLEDFRGIKILGNGIDIDILRKAGIERVDAFAAVTNGDNTNLMAAQMAKYIFQVPKVVCRVYDPRRSSIYHDLGLSTVCATTIGARMFRNILTSPSVLRAYQMGNGTAMALEFKSGQSVDGKKLTDMEIPGEFRISAVIRDNEPIIPEAGFILKSGDQIFGTVKLGQDDRLASGMEKVKKLFDISDTAINYPLKGGY